MPVYIVLAGNTGMVKIGWSAPGKVEQRMAHLQAHNQEHLKLLRLIDCGQTFERSIHLQFKQFRAHGEWFRFDQSMMGDVGAPDADATSVKIRFPECVSAWSDERRRAAVERIRADPESRAIGRAAGIAWRAEQAAKKAQAA